MPKEPILDFKYQDTEVIAKLTQLQKKTSDLTPAMRVIGEILVASTDERFEKEIDPDGNPWTPLSPYTLFLKKQEGRINKILQRTGLMRSRTNYQAYPDRVVVRNNDEKAAKHQLGIGVKQRRFLGISAEDRQEILDTISDYLAEE